MSKYEKSYEILKESYNKFFNVNETENSFEFLPGSIDNVVFSCPHAVPQTREGKEKLADINTGPLGMALHSLGYSVLVKTKNCNDDANYDKKSTYKDFLSNYIKRNNIEYLIDLHGMSKKRNVSISLGTSFGKNSDKSLELTNQFIKIADKNGLSVDDIRIDFPFSALKRTVSSYINKKNNIETLQIEINSKIFDSQELTTNLIKTLDEYAQLSRKVKTFTPPKVTAKNILKNDFLFKDEESQNVFKLVNLNSDILITAPHSCAMIKEGKECYKETFSGAIVKTLSESFNLSSCYKVKATSYDSNEEYLNQVGKFVENNKAKLILEFHIMNPIRYEDVSIVTNRGYSINNNLDIISILLKTLILNGFTRVSLDYPFNAFNLNSTVSLLYKKTEIPSLQIIINQRIFNNKRKLNKFINAITETIKKLNYLV